MFVLFYSAIYDVYDGKPEFGIQLEIILCTTFCLKIVIYFIWQNFWTFMCCPADVTSEMMSE